MEGIKIEEVDVDDNSVYVKEETYASFDSSLVSEANTMNQEKCRLLVQLYGANELLWNSKSVHYHNKSLRQDAWEEISLAMNVPASELKKKMTILLSSYRREKSRMAKSRSTGSGTDKVYVSKWFAFEDFNFMRDKEYTNDTSDTVPESISIIPNGTILESYNDDLVIPQTTDRAQRQVEEDNHKAPNAPKFRKIRRRSDNEEESPMLKKAFKILTESTSSSLDPYCSYGQHIANELRKYDKRTLAYVKQAINDVIFEADLGKYSQHSDCPQNYRQTHYDSRRYSPSPQPLVPFSQSPILSPQISTTSYLPQQLSPESPTDISIESETN